MDLDLWDHFWKEKNRSYIRGNNLRKFDTADITRKCFIENREGTEYQNTMNGNYYFFFRKAFRWQNTFFQVSVNESISFTSKISFYKTVNLNIITLYMYMKESNKLNNISH